MLNQDSNPLFCMVFGPVQWGNDFWWRICLWLCTRMARREAVGGEGGCGNASVCQFSENTEKLSIKLEDVPLKC